MRDTVMGTPGVREVCAATAMQVQGHLAGPTAAPLTVVTQCAGGRHRSATTAMALRAVVAGDIEEAATYGLAEAAKAFTTRGLVVGLVHRDLVSRPPGTHEGARSRPNWLRAPEEASTQLPRGKSTVGPQPGRPCSFLRPRDAVEDGGVDRDDLQRPTDPAGDEPDHHSPVPGHRAGPVRADLPR